MHGHAIRRKLRSLGFECVRIVGSGTEMGETFKTQPPEKRISGVPKLNLFAEPNLNEVGYGNAKQAKNRPNPSLNLQSQANPTIASRCLPNAFTDST